MTVFVKKEILGKKEKAAPHANWLGQIVFNNASTATVESRTGVTLNQSVKSAARKFHLSRAELLKLNH